MRDPSPYAGQTVKLRADAVELGGHAAEVVDWWANTNLDPTAADYKEQDYTVRGAGRLPDDDELLFARVDGMMRIIHVTEIEGYAPPIPMSGVRSGPLEARDIGATCPACEKPIEAGQMVTVVVLGPGGNPDARAAIDVHWPCATGDEQYGTGA